MNPDKLVAAGTGHRPNRIRIGSRNAYHPDVFGRVVDLAVAALETYQPDEVISGMAQGWDTALAMAAIEVGIPFRAFIPFEGQERKWSEDAQKQYHKLLKKAAEVDITTPGGYQPVKMHLRNERMVDHSNYLLALWSGDGGGTGACILYAEERGKPVKNLWPYWERYKHLS